MLERLRLLARYGAAGLVNTGVGFAVVILLDPVLGVAPALANAAGYAVGMAVGFVLNRFYVFRRGGPLPEVGARYAIVVAAAFTLNQGVLWQAGRVLGGGSMQHLAAQLAAIATYSIALFVLCQIWVFRAAPEAPAA
jgi:putative flippase GtrA